MTKNRKIVDARENSDGTISHIKFDTNQNFTTIEKAIEMLDNKSISVDNAHVVRPQNIDPYIRTNPDSSISNNLDEMAKD